MKLLISEADIKTFTSLNGYPLFCHQRRKKNIIKLILNSCKPESSILDIGCASGDIAVELSHLGYRVQAIDLEIHRVNQARKLAKKYGQNVTIENLEFEDLAGDRTYDLVLLGEVLEHFTEPVLILSEIRKLLNSNGKIVITTPNMPSLRNRLQFAVFGVFPDNNPEHKYYFDHRRFSNVVSTAEYDVLQFQTKFTNLLHKTKIISYFESIFLFWFSILFPRSGDTIFAIISPKNPISSNQ